MHKAKLAFVFLLSLLVVLMPVSSTLAETEKVEKTEKTGGKLENKKGHLHQGSVFKKMEKIGGKEANNKKLEKEEGEGLIGSILLGAAGVGVAIWNGIASGHRPSRIAERAFTLGAAGIAAGATIPEP